MKIISREEFLHLPENTLYSKFKRIYFEPLQIKGKTLGNDFTVLTLSNLVDFEIDNDWVDTMYKAIARERVQLDFEAFVRDGLYEEDVYFAIWEKEEIKKTY